MAKYKAQIVTKWLAPHDSETAYGPQLAEDYPLDGWTDVTGQLTENRPPNPNQYTIEATMDGEVLDTIESDPEYVVLWSELIPPEGT